MALLSHDRSDRNASSPFWACIWFAAWSGSHLLHREWSVTDDRFYTEEVLYLASQDNWCGDFYKECGVPGTNDHRPEVCRSRVRNIRKRIEKGSVSGGMSPDQTPMIRSDISEGLSNAAVAGVPRRRRSEIQVRNATSQAAARWTSGASKNRRIPTTKNVRINALK